MAAQGLQTWTFADPFSVPRASMATESSNDINLSTSFKDEN
jgi:hypothetical protein